MRSVRSKMLRGLSRNKVRKFYEQVKGNSQVHKPRTEGCKDESGNIIVEPQSMLRIWKDHFCRLYNGDEELNPAVRQDDPFDIDDESQQSRPPDLDEVKIAISKFSSNKAAGADNLNTELFKAAGDKTFRSMHQLI